MPCSMRLLLFTLIAHFITFNNAANILALFPMVTKSHSMIGYDLCETLAKRGHNVTHVSAFPRGTKLQNYHEVDLIDFVNPFQATQNGSNGILTTFNKNVVTHTNEVFDFLTEVTDTVLKDRHLQKILHSKQKFDVIIMGAFAQEALLGIGHHFNAPIIITSPPGMCTYVDDLVGNPAPFSYVPNIMLNYSDRMTFFQRLVNSLFGFYINIYKQVVHYPAQNKILHKYFPSAPDLHELTKNVAIIFSNSHETTLYPRPFVPNVVQVAGLHVVQPKPLPTELQMLMENAPYGIIYFSLGSNIRSQEMPVEIKKSFIGAFSKLKQKVLWKWDESTIEGLSDNVHLGKWYPQTDILAHPNVRLFITHGGRLSTIEALVRGVPLIGIPMFADQFINMNIANKHGYCLMLDYQNITEETISNAINEVLSTKKYFENVKRHSNIINDQLVHPLDKAVYWVEYVIRHKGAPHLRSAGADIPLYQYLLLDVIGFILLILLLIFSIIYFIVKNVRQYFKHFLKAKHTNIRKRKTE
ncbi:UDP-glycosyltransferase UGT5-like [Chrysoperla carnea]|uniref:UDP-glycosyltransferase UGT5-like n=1 Tax=Chrysoperla carnea TaxID=189513 RepID=UPI001D08637A|nr:UDP-glycosyltransferase UGT5-like [Chrysoperla carnea]